MARAVLVTEPLGQAGIAFLQQSYQVTECLHPSREELLRVLPTYDALVVRSATRVDAEVLQAGRRLKVVGRAGAGVDNIDLAAATRRGVVVVNAPGSNTVAVAEHTLALMLALARHVCSANLGMHAGRWEKKRLMGTELRDKVLGLVGLGRVGSEVAARARAFQMRIVAYDPFVSPERAAMLEVELLCLDELLARADYISLHAPVGEQTRGMISARELARMKPSARLINCARGELVVEEDLAATLQSGRIAGAALDVFSAEPNLNPLLLDCPNLLLTPHLGASTEEAQSEAALEVAREVQAVLDGRTPRYPVNAAALPAEEMAFMLPYLDLAHRMGSFFAQLVYHNVSHLELHYAGEVAEHDTSLLTAAVLEGLLAGTSEDPVNVVNARLVAKERGLVVSEMRTSEAQDWAGLIWLRAHTTTGERAIGGAVMRGHPHIVHIDGYWFDFAASGMLLVSEHTEQPGIIGQMGTLLGAQGISLSFVQVGRQERGGPGIMVLGLDDDLSDEAMQRVLKLPSVRSAHIVKL
ncbi:MAG: phosphoglycerate dehydrogenase [Anaerolineae bacterium]